MQYIIDRYSAMCASLGRTFGGSILDFCCGNGSIVDFMRRAGFDAYGFEPFAFAPSGAHFSTLGWPDPYAYTAKLNLNFPWRSVRLPYPDATFDFIYSQETLEHIYDHDWALRELARITKGSGVGVHTFPARYRLMEPHIHVPLGGVFKSKSYYALWYALSGINPINENATPRQVAEAEHYYATWSLNYPRPATILATAKRYFRHASFEPHLWDCRFFPWLYTRLKNVVLVVSDPIHSDH